jgi:hypothetical protein
MLAGWPYSITTGGCYGNIQSVQIEKAEKAYEHPRSSRTLFSEHFYRPGKDCCGREYGAFACVYHKLTALAIHRFQNKHSPGESHNEETRFH